MANKPDDLHAEQVQRFKRLSEISLALTGDPIDVFQNIAHLLGELLSVSVANLSEVRGDTLFFLSCYVKGAVFPYPGSCLLAKTPCATIEQCKDIRIYHNVTELFPETDFLRRHSAYTYCGFPALDGNGDVIGIICLLDEQPRHFTEEDRYLMKIVAQRIGAEMERQRIINENVLVIKELEQAVAKANDERARTESIIAAIGDGISIQNTDLKILYQNQIHKDFMGDHIGEHCYHAYEHNSAVCEGCPLAMSFLDGRIHTAERCVLFDGVPSYIEITASPLRDSSGEIIAGIEVVRDVTERHTLKSQLLQAQRMEAVGQLTGRISHDFNNLLTAILGFGGILQMDAASGSRARTYLDQILSAAERAAHLARGMLAFSRQQIMHPEPVNLDEIIINLRGILAHLLGEKIAMRIILKSGSLPVMADAGQIEQVLVNLAANARDAMPAGGQLAIETEVAEMDDAFIHSHGYGVQGTYALLSVSDTGTGMEEKVREKIFEPFFTTKEAGKGTGLGMSIVYGIIKQHNGYIDVSSEPQKGATFRIYLPFLKGQPVMKQKHPLPSPRGGTETVLIVEDDPGARTFMRIALEKFGYTVIEAAEGEEGVERFMQNRDSIHLLLLDVIMPKKNGKEVYNEIRKIRGEIKALFVSGYAGATIEKAGIDYTDLNFITKPLSPNDLARKVREVLDK
ncbi:MAG: response regulator [Alphaproteobacteria bacterium]|uniref:histidine kinase n=1 Tax=Candidatus Nitrobium versatile TaxID=2884831 RepID=A0A953J431_9BACT|nr:response regulator [Candidatus Nitrobium versatile]